MPANKVINADKRKNSGIALGIVISSVLLSVLLLAGYTAYAIWRGSSPRITPTEKRLLVTASVIGPYNDAVIVRTDHERFSKQQHFDNRLEVAYEYLHPEVDRPLVVRSGIEVIPPEKDHQRVHLARNRVLRELVSDNVTPRNDLFEWGNESVFSLVVDSDSTRGHQFVCRDGRTIYWVQIIGAELTSSQFLFIIEPYLQRLHHWDANQ